jgi:hypothetical protein
MVEISIIERTENGERAVTRFARTVDSADINLLVCNIDGVLSTPPPAPAPVKTRRTRKDKGKPRAATDGGPALL